MRTDTSSNHARAAAEGNRARTLVRFNALLFHALAVASFLERSAPGPVSGQVVAEAGADTTGWLSGVWQPRREARARELQAYIEATWPEFDWISAYEAFCRSREERPVWPVARTNSTCSVLQRCVLASQAAAFYRATARCADDPALRELLRAAATDHARCFEFFRSCYALSASRQRAGVLAACRAVLEASRLARDCNVADAFQSLSAHWYGTPTISPLGYQEFLGRMVPLIVRHAGLGWLEKMVFSPWSGRAASRPAADVQPGQDSRTPRSVPLKKAA